jgi:hypothetical protein
MIISRGGYVKSQSDLFSGFHSWKLCLRSAKIHLVVILLLGCGQKRCLPPKVRFTAFPAGRVIERFQIASKPGTRSEKRSQLTIQDAATVAPLSHTDWTEKDADLAVRRCSESDNPASRG